MWSKTWTLFCAGILSFLPLISRAQPSSCTPPIQFSQVSAIEGHSGLCWEETGQAQRWTVAWGTVGTAADQMTQSIQVANTWVLLPVSGTQPQEAYVKSDCGGRGSSWVGPVALAPLNHCNALAGFSAMRDTLCDSGKASFNLPSGHEGIWWWGSDPIHFGNAFTSEALSSDRTFWVSRVESNGGPQCFGPKFTQQIGGYANFSSGQIISVHDTLLLDSITFAADGATRFMVEIWNSNRTARLFTTDTLQFDQAGITPFQTSIPLIPGKYFMGVNVLPGGGRLFRSTSLQSYPMEMPGLMRIDSASNGVPNRYYYFYDLKIRALCASSASLAHAHVGFQGIAGDDKVDTLCIQDSVLMLNDLIQDLVTPSGYWLLNGGDTLNTLDLKTQTSGSRLKVRFVAPGSLGCNDTAVHDLFFKDCGIGAPELISEGVYCYPNPTSGVITIAIPTTWREDGWLTLCDPSGRMVGEYPLTGNQDAYTFSFEDCSSGVYFAQIQIGHRHFVERIVIQ